MSDSSAFGFGKFIPGFDFLQSLGKPGQGAAAMPPFAHWIAPTVSVEELDKRIEELKAVQFWLEQNSRALSATVQALEVQRMTLSALQGMNVNLADLGKAFPFAAASSSAGFAASPAAAVAPSQEQPGRPLSDWPMSASTQAAAPGAPTSPPAEAPAAQSNAPQVADTVPPAAPTAGMAHAMQWWGALTQQFQHIAQQAMQDPAQQQAVLQATQMGSELAQTAVKTASDMVRRAAAKTPATAAAQPAASAGKIKAAVKPVKKTAPTSTAPRKAVAKKAALADKKAPSVAAKGRAVAAKKSTVSKPRSR
jgi:hypothetical protein